MNTAINLGTTPHFIKGYSLKARDLQAVRDAARVGASIDINSRDVHTIVDRDGVHQRKIATEATTTAGASWFWGVVTAVYPSQGYVLARRASGQLGQLRPASDATPTIKVWVGFETFLRSPQLSVYDEIMCFENPADVDAATYPYSGFAMMPGFAFVEPVVGYSAVEDAPSVIADG